jgi:hypothetical protein
MLSSVVENCRKEMARYKKMTVYAVIKKNFPTNEEMPYFSLNCIDCHFLIPIPWRDWRPP